MTFEDLPQDWPDRPLTDPRLVTDVLDLLVPERDRRTGAVCLLMCDTEDRLVTPVVVNDLPPRSTEEERTRMLRVFIGAGEGVMPDGAVLLAIARRDHLSISADDEVWARALLAATTTHRVLGVHVVTLRGSREVPRSAFAA